LHQRFQLFINHRSVTVGIDIPAVFMYDNAAWHNNIATPS